MAQSATEFTPVCQIGSWATSSSLKTDINYFGGPQRDTTGSGIEYVYSVYVAMVCIFITTANCQIKMILLFFNQLLLNVHKLLRSI